MEEKKKKIYERPLLVYLITVSGLAIFLSILALFDEKGISIGSYFLYGGVIIAFIGFLFINTGAQMGDGRKHSRYLRDEFFFKKVRKKEKPFQRVV